MNFDKILKEQERLNVNNQFSTIDRETGELLQLLVKIKNPKNIMELGTSIGYSTIWLASCSKGKLTTIERWHERAFIAKRFFKRTNLNINLLEGDALKILPKLKTKFDFVFMDATKKEYLMYLRLIKLNKNAVIVADNTVSHADKMKDFLAYADKKSAVTLNIGKGITVFKT